MAHIERSEKKAPATSFSRPEASQPILKTVFYRTRPIILGILALLAVLGCCQAYGNPVRQSYDESSYSVSPSAPTKSESDEAESSSAAESNALPLLFLSFVGLAGMALSRTGPSKDDRP